MFSEVWSKHVESVALKCVSLLKTSIETFTALLCIFTLVDFLMFIPNKPPLFPLKCLKMHHFLCSRGGFLATWNVLILYCRCVAQQMSKPSLNYAESLLYSETEIARQTPTFVHTKQLGMVTELQKCVRRSCCQDRSHARSPPVVESCIMMMVDPKDESGLL